MSSEKQIQLKWTNSRTLYAQVEIQPRILPEEEEALEKSKAPAADTGAPEMPSTPDTTVKQDTTHHIAHHVVKERQTGKLKRAFYFYVDVDRESMVANLRNGVLELTITKRDDKHASEHHEVKVVPHSEDVDDTKA